MNNFIYGESNEYQLFCKGYDIITSSSAATAGNWFSVVPTNGSVQFSACTGTDGVTDLSGQTIDKQIYGHFTSIRTNSGVLIAYKLK